MHTASPTTPDPATPDTLAPFTIRPLTLSAITPRPVRWLWPGRIPLGKLTILEGDSGLGKSTLLHDLAARLTTAHPLPDAPPPPKPNPRTPLPSPLHPSPSSVLLLCAEDDLADTVRPRLEAAGADLDRVLAIPDLPTGPDQDPFTLPDHTPHLYQLVPPDCRLLVIDPLAAYLAPTIRSGSPQALRRVLAPLRQLAETLDLAVVLVRHATTHLVHCKPFPVGRATGLAAARAGLLVAADPHDSSRKKRLLLTPSARLGPPPPSLAFHLETALNGAAAVVWDGPVSGPAFEPETPADTIAMVRAGEVLEDALEHGPALAADVLALAKRRGVSHATLRRAKKLLMVRSRKLSPAHPGGPGWLWAFPEHDWPAWLDATPASPTPPPP